MSGFVTLALPLGGYFIRLLTPANAGDLQHLYDQCADYALLEQGRHYLPNAAIDDFQTVPEGKTTRDKFIFGLFDSGKTPVGMIECIRSYPDEQTWWLGLMMLAPEQRGQAVGSTFYRAFEHWAVEQGAQHISLAVLAENRKGNGFWQKLGFERVRVTPPRPYGNKIHVLYVMRKAVGTTI